ncbi:dihydroxyacetone kinase subunit DhaL [Oceanobacillus caeni]|uniref:Dihydroxyacetone kinase n=1 Tax=Oceanobacillus caeni TaxID=405946 RepID=A0ABR5MMQ0_9BACI|nr:MULTISPECIES: dihydroxyacetone kinase subunit DhaL [Bacillaceae]KPH78202.1 dihydroxyacetone kinase [Oceanobacillus caeni]MBU8791113.1 dihydroxyacetone kinase subunit L [Oceanobacillus caeni]MCR1834797.1 dihydroxyacetone kinase subunit DhaL [Oceanobacillus caeni]MED4474475.1 dihydroxyacetone kinase subunit DhaL [Oceanobacillus caeni]
MNLTAKQLKDYFKEIVEMIEKEKDYLCELDRKLGDGDHGVTMSIGWQAVNEKLNNELAEEQDCAKISLTVGKTFLSAVGSSVGPLYATGFMRGAKAVKGKTEMNDNDLAEYWIAFAKGIKERGQAEVGDKTMIDTLEPFFISLEKQFAESNEFLPAFTTAVEEAKKGMESTKDIVSKKGRSSRLGERSIGAQDPGATSAYLILSTFLNFVKGQVEVR